MRAPAPQPRFERCPVGARRPAARAGLTLIELVVVMGLIGVLLGAGIGMLSTLNLGERAAIGLVQNVIRAARNTALARSSPAIVRIDRAAGTISAEGTQVVGTWHFEDERMRGGRQLDGRIGGAEVVSGGYIGKALSFTKAQRGSVATVPIDGGPAEPRCAFVNESALPM